MPTESFPKFRFFAREPWIFVRLVKSTHKTRRRVEIEEMFLVSPSGNLLLSFAHPYELSLGLSCGFHTAFGCQLIAWLVLFQSEDCFYRQPSTLLVYVFTTTAIRVDCNEANRKVCCDLDS